MPSLTRRQNVAKVPGIFGIRLKYRKCHLVNRSTWHREKENAAALVRRRGGRGAREESFVIRLLFVEGAARGSIGARAPDRLRTPYGLRTPDCLRTPDGLCAANRAGAPDGLCPPDALIAVQHRCAPNGLRAPNRLS